MRNGEAGMRPPAHRGLGLRPGGKWEGGMGKYLIWDSGMDKQRAKGIC